MHCWQRKQCKFFLRATGHPCALLSVWRREPTCSGGINQQSHFCITYLKMRKQEQYSMLWDAVIQPSEQMTSSLVLVNTRALWLPSKVRGDIKDRKLHCDVTINHAQIDTCSIMWKIRDSPCDLGHVVPVGEKRNPTKRRQRGSSTADVRISTRYVDVTRRLLRCSHAPPTVNNWIPAICIFRQLAPLAC